MARTRAKSTAGPTDDQDTLVVPDFLESGLRAGHPWIYRNHVPGGFTRKTGSWLRVRAGRTSVWGLWDEDSSIAVRVFSTEGPLTAKALEERLQRAAHHRRARLSFDTTAFRLINGEGDGLPGVVVDVYGEYAVIATYSQATYSILPGLVEALRSLNIRHVVHRATAGGTETNATAQQLLGARPPEDLVITERGVRFYADLIVGHKTGLYLDQRDNRKTFSEFAARGNVLNLFAYTGSFSVVTALTGAVTTSVDISQPALNRARDNFRLNGLDPNSHEFIAEDCYEYLSRLGKTAPEFDAVVCDPPSLARNRAQLDKALQAYLRLNALGLRRVRDGGYYAAASCTAQVSPEAFRHMLAMAVVRAGKSAQIVHEAGHAIDHPIAVGHAEGRYLKFVVLRVFG